MIKMALAVLAGVVVGSVATIAILPRSTVDSSLPLPSLDAHFEGRECEAGGGPAFESPQDFEGRRKTVQVENPSNIESPDQTPTNADIPGDTAPAEAGGLKRPNTSDTTKLPDIYKSLLEPTPVSKRRMSPQENHAFFAQDVRDESWAYTMEVGINEYLAANQKTNGAIIESVECRSRMCEIAGVVYPGSEDDFEQHVEAMRGSGWWQLSQSHHTTGGNVNGEYRFVTFIPRDSEDTLVLQYASSVCD